jgi:hypothetical protein
MACSKCKKKEMREQMEKEIQKVEKWVLLSIVLMVGAAVYGLYSMIKDLI